MGKINTFFSNFSGFMAAAGFAEEGEHEMARQILKETCWNNDKLRVSGKGMNKAKLSLR